MASNERLYSGHKAPSSAQPPRAGSNAIQDLLTGDDYQYQSTQPPLPSLSHDTSTGGGKSQHTTEVQGRSNSSPDLQAFADWSQPASLSSNWNVAKPKLADKAEGLSLDGPAEGEVDGLSAAEVDALFREADHDGDGRLAGNEAKAFFQRTSLPVQALSKIWNRVKAAKPAEGSGLTREQFGVALRLVAFAQNEPHPTPEAMEAAASPAAWQAVRGQPLPMPKLLPDVRPSSARPSSAATARTSSEGARFALPPFTPTASPFRGTSAGAGPSLEAHTVQGSSPGSMDSSGMLSNGSTALLRAPEGPSKAHLPPVVLDVRLPPLHPKVAAQLQFMTVGHGSLFAGPTRQGGVLQWGSIEGEVSRPELPPGVVRPQDSWTPAGEDADAGPSTEVRVQDAGQVTCTFADHLSNILWMGHSDGRVSAFSMGDAPGTAVNGQLLHCWQAHRVGAITSLCRTPWGNLWTGTSRGWIRIWDCADPGAFNDAGEYALPMRELRRHGGARPHIGSVSHMICPAGGQVVWSGSERAILLWCAYTGAYVGALISTETEPLADTEQQQPAAEAEERKHMVDPAKGLEVSSDGRALARPPRQDLEQWVEEQVAWAASSETTSAQYMEAFAFRRGKALQGAGKAAKFLGKLGRRVARTQKYGGGGTADAAPTPLIHEAHGGTPGPSKSSKHLLNVEPPDYDDLADVSVRSGWTEQSMTQDKSVGLRCLTSSSDGHVFAGFHSGHLKCYTALGRLVWKKDMGHCVRCLASLNHRLWVGLADGRMRVLGEKTAGSPGTVQVEEEWLAHEAGVVALAPAQSRMVSMAADGSIRAWSSAVGCPQEQLARRQYMEEANNLVERHEMEVACITWNVNEARPDPSTGLHRWVIDLAKEASMFVVALQEIESGGGSLALAAAKDALLTKQQERGNANAQAWNSAIQSAVGEGWQRLGLRQLSGMLVLVYIRSDLLAHTGEVSTASIACGVLGMGGNKGAVAVSFSLYRRRIAFVCSHFAAHQNMVEARNANYATICRHLCFGKRGAANVEPDVSSAGGNRADKARHAADTIDNGSDSDDETPPEPKLLRGQGLKEMDMLVWLGDFNYRVDAEYAEAKGLVRRNDLSLLLSKDQLKLEMAAGRTFVHLQEAPITFRPTYKFDKHSQEPLDYDSSEKRRVPAWTDRILFRGSQARQTSGPDGGHTLGGSLYGRVYSIPAVPRDRPSWDGSNLWESGVASAEQSFTEGTPGTPRATLSRSDQMGSRGRVQLGGALGSASEVTVEAKTYSACMDVMQSDHKPVCALLNIVLPNLAPPQARRLSSELLGEVFAAVEPAKPRLSLTPDLLELHQVDQAAGTVTVSNLGNSCASFHVCAMPQGGAEHGPIPDWLDVHPTSGELPPQASVLIHVSAALSENVYSTRASVAELVIVASDEYGRGLGRYERQTKDHISFTVNCKTAGCVSLGGP
ncbi:g9852 [Coccomyxa viridis]|uniref:G9852 protein n=1 Tax=Coccomyxa viridis TaxID=1274662 RepID=A0ABP1G6M0_9CHLO